MATKGRLECTAGAGSEGAEQIVSDNNASSSTASTYIFSEGEDLHSH